LVGNDALSTGNGALLVGNGALSTGNGALLVGNEAMPASNMALPDCGPDVHGDNARSYADTRRRTDDNASADSIDQPISPDVHLPSPVPSSRRAMREAQDAGGPSHQVRLASGLGLRGRFGDSRSFGGDFPRAAVTPAQALVLVIPAQAGIAPQQRSWSSSSDFETTPTARTGPQPALG